MKDGLHCFVSCAVLTISNTANHIRAGTASEFRVPVQFMNSCWIFICFIFIPSANREREERETHTHKSVVVQTAKRWVFGFAPSYGMRHYFASNFERFAKLQCVANWVKKNNKCWRCDCLMRSGGKLLKNVCTGEEQREGRGARRKPSQPSAQFHFIPITADAFRFFSSETSVNCGRFFFIRCDIA